MALDEPNNDDSVVEQNSFTFCINKELLSSVKSVTIDMSYMGFDIEPEIPLTSTGGGCGSGGCSSGGCGS